MDLEIHPTSAPVSILCKKSIQSTCRQSPSPLSLSKAVSLFEPLPHDSHQCWCGYIACLHKCAVQAIPAPANNHYDSYVVRIQYSHLYFSHQDVSDAAQYSHKVKHIPSVFQVVLRNNRWNSAAVFQETAGYFNIAYRCYSPEDQKQWSWGYILDRREWWRLCWGFSALLHRCLELHGTERKDQECFQENCGWSNVLLWGCNTVEHLE